jgi:hypothetical protein
MANQTREAERMKRGNKTKRKGKNSKGKNTNRKVKDTEASLGGMGAGNSFLGDVADRLDW